MVVKTNAAAHRTLERRQFAFILVGNEEARGRNGASHRAPSVRDYGVTQKSIAQLVREPESVLASSTENNFHVPDADVPTIEAKDVSG